MDTAALRVCALVAYDGTEYHGFQYQVGAATIQEQLESALGHVAEFHGHVVGAGRTDAGVHASGQVVAAEVQWRHSLRDLQRAWNAHLPHAIRVWRVRQAPEGFHPRYSAIERTYRYTVYQARNSSDPPVRSSPLTDRYGLYVTGELDLAAMQAAAAALVGEHDFATFGQPPQGEQTVRTVRQAEWHDGSAHLVGCDPLVARCLLFVISANAFLRQMVRSIVGTLIEVGNGNWTVAKFEAALAARDRSRSAPPAAPNGLLLARVTYPAHLSVLDEPVDSHWQAKFA